MDWLKENGLKVIGMLIVVILFVSGGVQTAQANKQEIVKVKARVAEHDEEIESLRDTDASRAGEIANIKGDIEYHTDILEAVANKLNVPLPIKRPSK